MVCYVHGLFDELLIAARNANDTLWILTSFCDKLHLAL
jgi:hypothetical protein